MQKNPLVSIVVPAYKAEKFLPETIESVINQTYKNWELIIVDDGSPNPLENVVKPYMEKDNRIKYFRKENGGVSSARNYGFYKSRGEFVCFLDADDVFLPENLEKKVNALLKSEKEYGFVYSDIEVIGENNNSLYIKKLNSSPNLFVCLLLWEYGGIFETTPSNLLYKREVFDKTGLFNENLSTAADQEMAFRVAKYYKGIYIPEVLLYYRIHSNNMHSNISLMEKDHILAYKLAEKNNLFPNKRIKRRAFSNLYLILAGSWWKNGNNKKRAIKFMLKAFLTDPINFISKISKKILKKL